MSTGMNLRSGLTLNPVLTMPPEHVPAFQAGIRGAMTRWTALRLAVENEWGGMNSREKANQLELDIFDWFFHGKGARYADELEDLLDDSINNDFNVECEDGSPQEVSVCMVQIWHECCEGNYAMAEKMATAPPAPVQASVKEYAEDSIPQLVPAGGGMGMEGAGAGGEGGGDMEMDEEPPAPKGPDADGWETVPTRRKGRR